MRYLTDLVYTVHISRVYNYMRAREFKLPEYVVFFNRQFKHRSPLAFGNEIEVYLTHLRNEFDVLSHGFGIPNVRDGKVERHGGF